MVAKWAQHHSIILGCSAALVAEKARPDDIMVVGEPLKA